MREENIFHQQQYEVRTATMATHLQGLDLLHRGAGAYVLVLFFGS
jgi:hypothetical protein